MKPRASQSGRRRVLRQKAASSHARRPEPSTSEEWYLRAARAQAHAPQAPTAAGGVAGLQSAAGNQAVNRLLRDADGREIHRLPGMKTAAAKPGLIQRKPVANVGSVGLFSDVGNGLFGSQTPVTANDVLQVVRAIRASDEATGARTNIKILTGTHGTAQGHLVGEQLFFQEDLENEGHKGGGGWVNVYNVRNKSKSQIASWKDSRANFAVILAWCYSARSEANWANVHATWGKGSDGKHIWAW